MQVRGRAHPIFRGCFPADASGGFLVATVTGLDRGALLGEAPEPVRRNILT
jgi:hypothetical protein